MENRQTRLKIFKYNAILSILFFLSSTFYLSGQIENYSFSKYTISAMSRFLTEDKLSYFNAVFFIKSFLDLSFTFYVFKYFRLYVFSPTAVSWLIAVLSFGLLGFFPAFFWTISEFLFAKLTKNEGFQFLTNNLLLIQIITIFLFVLTNNFNAIFEIFYLFLIFFWLIVFISRHLK